MNEFSRELATQFYTSIDQFPVDFSLVWQWLGYASKQKCLDKLKGHFEIDEDFTQTTVVNSSQSGGRPSNAYYMTVDCFKMLAMMAGTSQGKIIRQYFLDCETQLKKKLAQPKTLTAAQLILAQAQALVDLEESVAKVTKEQLEQNYRLEAIEQRSLEAANSLNLLPPATVTPPEMSTKAHLSRLVRNYVFANNLDYRRTWNHLYREHKDRYHIDLKIRGKNYKPKLSAPAYAEMYGHIDQLYAIAHEVFVTK